MRRRAESGVRDGDAGRTVSGDGGEARTIDWTNLSHALLPAAVRHRAIHVRIETERDVYDVDDPVQFRVAFRNRLPVPVVLRTAAPVPWTWSVDGHVRASRVADPLPSERGLFRFARRETKTFVREWGQRIRDRPREWSAVGPGEYTLRAWVNTDGSTLAAETTVRVEDGQSQ